MTAAKFELAFTRCRNNLKTVGNLPVKSSLQDFDAKEACLHPKNLSVSFQKRLKLFCFHHFQVFTRSSFPNVPIRVPFSKSTVFKICRQKMCHFRVNRRPFRRIFHRFQHVPSSCERSLSLLSSLVNPLFFLNENSIIGMVNQHHSQCRNQCIRLPPFSFVFLFGPSRYRTRVGASLTCHGTVTIFLVS